MFIIGRTPEDRDDISEFGREVLRNVPERLIVEIEAAVESGEAGDILSYLSREHSWNIHFGDVENVEMDLPIEEVAFQCTHVTS